MEEDTMFKNCSQLECEVIGGFIDQRLQWIELSEEAKLHLMYSPLCSVVFMENLRLKQLVKKAVGQTLVPSDLALRIKTKIGALRTGR